MVVSVDEVTVVLLGGSDVLDEVVVLVVESRGRGRRGLGGAGGGWQDGGGRGLRGAGRGGRDRRGRGFRGAGRGGQDRRRRRFRRAGGRCQGRGRGLSWWWARASSRWWTTWARPWSWSSRPPRGRAIRATPATRGRGATRACCAGMMARLAKRGQARGRRPYRRPPAVASEPQVHPLEPLHRLGHQRVLLRLVLRQVRHREAQVRPRVVPRHAADRLLVDQELRRLLGVGERPVAGSPSGAAA